MRPQTKSAARWNRSPDLKCDLWPQIENPRPMRPSIDGFVDAALLVGAINAGTISVSQSADVNDVRILRIDHDPADLARVLQPDVIPSCAAVNGFVAPLPEERSSRMSLSPVPA